ncbi:hypothetical protein [Actinomadura roseirufa]|uniref:hypothetical protein n=1 Tax=Actinomadura roseirufa TaxID=2094049 RepID=UPI0010413759|nr:hypothetical protein [Actinomadura roseirufa]
MQDLDLDLDLQVEDVTQLSWEDLTKAMESKPERTSPCVGGCGTSYPPCANTKSSSMTNYCH